MHENDSAEGCRAVTTEVVEAVARAKGVDPRTMEPKLHDVVDPDALERLAGTDGTCVSFEYDEYTVLVDGEGVVTVEETAATLGGTDVSSAFDGTDDAVAVDRSAGGTR